MKREIERYVLDNAVKYNGKANLGAVVGHLFAKHPELKKDSKKSIKEIERIVRQVNKLKLKEQKERLKKLGKVVRKHVEKSKLPKVKNTKKVVVRFAPNPNGPVHIGHCRTVYWNYMLAKKYKGSFIVRFDDTDPKVKIPIKEAYGWFKEDLKWLGLKPDKYVVQSSRLNKYYKYAEELIKAGKAYVDTRDVNFMRGLLKRKEASEERDIPAKVQLSKWKKMFKDYKEGRAVLRIKTDLQHPNPAVRDWVAFRIIDNGKHPLVKAKVWPTLNFASAIDDHELKVTHIIRGIDLSISDVRQKFIYNYFGWTYPETIYHGKLLVEGIKSSSQARLMIEEKKFSGWDDVRLGTIKSLRRKGFQPEAIKKFLDSTGLTRSDSKVSLDKLAALNKDFIDEKTKRYFFVQNPKKIKIKDAPKLKIKAPLHPEKKLGHRHFETKNEFYISDKLKKGKKYRFMHLFNFKDKKFISKDLDLKLKATLIHWLPVSRGNIRVEILMNDGKIVKGLGENNLKNVKIGDVIQFERFGFVRLEKKDKKYLFVYCHG